LRAAQAQGLAPAYVATLLAHFSAGTPPGASSPPGRAGATPTPVEGLTEREQAVLRLLAAGLGGPEIAAALVVSPSTIKTHLKNLYSKLDAHSRDQALARARDLHLL
jgi:LuxR family maltose regulon positive regulatory protein